MRKPSVLALSAVVVVSAGTVVALRDAAPVLRREAPEPLAASDLGRLPLTFIENRGQADPRVGYYLQGGGNFVSFKPDGLAFSLADRSGTSGRWGLLLDFVGVDGASLSAGGRMPGTVNYLTGDPDEWLTDVPTYSQVVYEDLWPGIDLSYRSGGDRLKYSFRVAPGADPSRIRLAWRGASDVRVADGRLHVATPAGTINDDVPVSYQGRAGTRTAVPAAYSLRGATYGFDLGDYDRGRPLVIDPAVSLRYSTLVGGSFDDNALAIAVDEQGAAYITGETQGGMPVFPTTPGAYDTSPNGFRDAFVVKLTPAGDQLVYATFLGSAAADKGRGIAVDGAGAAYVTGSTPFNNFPTTPGAYDTTDNGSNDAFVTKLTPSGGGLAYSTFLGGSASDLGVSIAVDGTGAAFVTGETEDGGTDLPSTPGAYDPTHNGAFDAFVAKFTPSGDDLVYATFLGGAGSFEGGRGIAVDGAGAAYVTGVTQDSTTDLPTTPGAYDTTHNGSLDAFVAKLNAAGSALEYSTFLGGTAGDQAHAIALDATGAAHVTGQTADGDPDFPTTPGAHDTTHNGGDDAFAVRLSASGDSLVSSTFLGGSGSDLGQGIAVDSTGAAHVTGSTADAPTDLAATPDAYDPTHNGMTDAFLARIGPLTGALVYATFFGGSGFDAGYGVAPDRVGAPVVTGNTSDEMPTTPGAFDTTPNGGNDVFVAAFTTPYECRARAVTQLGTEGGDALTGTTGKDAVLALGGNDRIKVLGGKDRVCAGGGKDKVVGGGGRDRLLGEKGKDKVKGSGGNDRLSGGPGKDTCNGGGGTKDKASRCEKEIKVP